MKFKEGDFVVFVHLNAFMTYEEVYVVQPNFAYQSSAFTNVICDNGSLRTFTSDAFIPLSEYRQKNRDKLIETLLENQ
jgi:hypothetical protein